MLHTFFFPNENYISEIEQILILTVPISHIETEYRESPMAENN